MKEKVSDIQKELEIEKSLKSELAKEADNSKVKCDHLEKKLTDYKTQV